MRPRTLAVLLILVVALGGFIWLYERDLPSTEERAELSRRLVRLDVDSVRSVVLRSGEQHVRLARSGVESDPNAAIDAEGGKAESAGMTDWILTEPRERRADDTEVESFLERLRDLDKHRTIEDVSRDQLGLDPPRAEVGLETSTGEVVLRFGSEIPASSNAVVEVGDGPPFYVVSGDLVEQIAREPNEWRSRDAVPFREDRIQKLEILDPEGRVVLERSGEGFRITAPIEDAADRTAVDDLLQALVDLEAEDFLEDSVTDLPAGGAAIRLTVDGVAAPVVVEIAPGATGDEDEAMIRVGSEVFSADTELASLVARTPADWRSTEWTDLDAFEVEAVRVRRHDGEERSFELSEGEWKRGEEGIDYSVMSDFLRSMTQARGVPTESDAAVEGPVVEIGLESSDGREETLSLWGAGDRHTAGKLGRPARLELGAEAVDEFWAALEKLEAQAAGTATTEPE